MSPNHPDCEGVVLTDVAEALKAAEEENGPWPELAEPQLEYIPQRSDFAERVSLWAAVGILGAVTIYAITRGSDDLLKVVMIAAVALYRLPPKCAPGDRDNDPRPKRRRKKRTPSG